MRGQVLGDAGVPSEPGYEVLQIIGSHATAGDVAQQRQPVAAVRDRGLDGLHRQWRERDDGRLVALGGPQHQGVVPGVAHDGGDFAGDQLTAAQAIQPKEHRCPPVAAAPFGRGQPVLS